MDLMRPNLYRHESAALSPLKSPPPLVHSSHNSFPILVVAIIGILATAFLLVGYYIFVIKCCLNWHRIDLLRRFSFSRRRRVDDPLMVYSQAAENRGLEEAVIRSIPVFRFKKGGGGDGKGDYSAAECAVCLNEFQENEKLRSIPNCAHMFHIDCIDVWLQNNANCPLCRNSISISISATSIYHHHPPPPMAPITTGGDEDFVVIEIGPQNQQQSSTTTATTNQELLRVQERLNSGEISAPISPSPRKLVHPKMLQKKVKKFGHVSSMGDECIDIRQKDEQFAVQPIRRSISMDSAADRQLYLAVQEIIQQHRQQNDEGSSNRVKRSFFSFGHGRGSKSTVSPVDMEL